MTPYTQEDYYRDPDKRRVHDHYSLFLIGALSLWMLVVIALGILGYHFLRHFDPISCPTGQVFTPPRPSTLALIAYIITCYILWIARFWRGYSILAAGRAIANPRTAWLPRATELPS